MPIHFKLRMKCCGNLYLQSQKNLGVITTSSGNFAVALAYQGNSLGIPVTVLLPENTSPVKIRMCEKYYADTRIGGVDEREVMNMLLASCFLSCRSRSLWLVYPLRVYGVKSVLMRAECHWDKKICPCVSACSVLKTHSALVGIRMLKTIGLHHYFLTLLSSLFVPILSS